MAGSVLVSNLIELLAKVVTDGVTTHGIGGHASGEDQQCRWSK